MMEENHWSIYAQGHSRNKGYPLQQRCDYCLWTGDSRSSWGERQWATGGKIFSFCVVNIKTQVHFEIHNRKEEPLANILRPSVKGIVAEGLQVKKPKETVMATETLQSIFFLSGNWNCLHNMHFCCWAYLDKIAEFGKHLK